MTKVLKDYQIEAIENIIVRFNAYISFHGSKIGLRAPTGSGKTFIMTKLLERICDEHENEPMCFIWASIGKGELHKQSYRSVKSELNGNPDCQLLEPSFVSSHDAIDNKQILFVNWEKLITKDKGTDTWKNSLMKDQEGKNFLDLITETKNRGIKIVLIIDESHIGENADSHTSQFRNNIIDPDVTLMMSATLPDQDKDVEILLDDAIEEGMIKENLLVNKGITEDSIDVDDDSLKLVLKYAENKRKEIVSEYTKLKVKVNPLVLVQVPNTELGDDTISLVKNFLQGEGITEENGLLAVWLNNYKNFDSEKIKKNNNEIRYMIFKTVVDTGWDCPRAHILVKFRDVQSTVSKIQTIGRILRTPEAKKYNNEILDNGYIYTNMEYIDPRNDEYSPNRIKNIVVHIKKDDEGNSIYNGLGGLESFYKSRQSSYNSADTRICDIIDEVFCSTFKLKEAQLTNKSDLEQYGVKVYDIDQSSIMKETETTLQELQSQGRIGGGLFNMDVKSADIEIRGKYETIISQHLNGLARVRSLSPIKQGMAKTIQNHIFGITRSTSLSYTQLLVVKNETIFGDIIDKATLEFKTKYPDANANGKYEEYEIQDERAYSSETYKKIESRLSLYDEMYVEEHGTSELERRFIAKLDSTFYNKIEWVWHNGSEPNVVNFGVMIESDAPSFRPDFIIKFKDGRIGIFDTKDPEYRLEDTAPKANALAKYIADSKLKKHNVFGGIIVEHSGNFYLNESNNYKTIIEDRSQWQLLSTRF
ncbi:MAG: DEAD/DEAH box helicase family protein [Lachnospiraceae bacterium]|jgi:type III restriction enzyme|nr:DEAD/DEAH box helicase family protein [Lachnospiraceae bacterium]